ncbi:MAG: hypothetical protein QOJ22_781 [Thermoleophilaceae bacterium]|nr:hypothetical protein [Thermoleophilaceae bacterium]
MESTTETTTTTTVVRREIEIAARPETVWEFFVDPEKLARWKGKPATAFDPREGGAYRIEIVPGHTASGEYVELDPPRRLVYTWGWEATADGPNPVPPGSSTIEVELVPTGTGTTVHFTHRDLPGVEAAESHAHGWDHYLPRLVVAAGGGDPGRDPWLDGQM